MEYAMQNDQQSIMNSLKDEGPEAWLAYLRPIEQGEQMTALSMLVVYPFAARRARDQGSLDWAEVAVRAAELEARNHSGVEREDALLWAMQLRSWFISKMGSRPNHLILDKDIILLWAMEGVNLSAGAAKEKAAPLGDRLAGLKNSSNPKDKQDVLEDLRLLRRMKNRLNVVKVLADCSELPSDSPLYKWLEIREQLP
jgi:hypothetical protein